jgi:hypothetical protein
MVAEMSRRTQNAENGGAEPMASTGLEGYLHQRGISCRGLPLKVIPVHCALKLLRFGVLSLFQGVLRCFGSGEGSQSEKNTPQPCSNRHPNAQATGVLKTEAATLRVRSVSPAS